MNEEEFKKMLNENYDEKREMSLLSMIHDFYNKKMRSIVILVWSFGLIFIAGAVYCAVQYFKVEQTKSLIMYAVGFIVFVHWVDLMKLFAWQFIHRNGLKREIKRLELRIAELTEIVRKQ